MRYLAVVLLAATFLTFSCSESVVNNGSGGSEITNGKVIACNGRPASGIDVTAYPVTYISGKSDTLEKKTSVTDRNGNFTIGIDSGMYNIFIIDTISGSGKLIRDIGPKTDLNTLYLDTLGFISGTVNLNKQNPNDFIAVYCIGTPLLQWVHPQSNVSKYVFNGVPAGEYSLSIAKFGETVGCAPGTPCGVEPNDSSNNLEAIRVESGKEASFNVDVNVDSLGFF